MQIGARNDQSPGRFTCCANVCEPAHLRARSRGTGHAERTERGRGTALDRSRACEPTAFGEHQTGENNKRESNCLSLSSVLSSLRFRIISLRLPSRLRNQYLARSGGTKRNASRCRALGIIYRVCRWRRWANRAEVNNEKFKLIFLR